MTDVTLTTTPHPPTPAPVSGDYPLSTLCLRLDVDGVMLSWTLRGDDSDVASRLPRVLDYIKRLQAKLPPGRPWIGVQGRRQGQATPETPAPAAVPAAPLAEREDYCPIHQVAMVQQSNERGTWFSHRAPEGWCRGKRRKAGA